MLENKQDLTGYFTNEDDMNMLINNPMLMLDISLKLIDRYLDYKSHNNLNYNYTDNKMIKVDNMMKAICSYPVERNNGYTRNGIKYKNCSVEVNNAIGSYYLKNLIAMIITGITASIVLSLFISFNEILVLLIFIGVAILFVKAKTKFEDKIVKDCKDACTNFLTDKNKLIFDRDYNTYSYAILVEHFNEIIEYVKFNRTDKYEKQSY